MNRTETGVRRWWIHQGAYVLAIAFACAGAFLMFQKHAAYNTRTYDLARFDQAIWNTLHGRLLYSSIRDMCILGNHFSPFLALLSPLFLIWNDVRMLFLVQMVSVAVTGLLLFRIVRARHAALAPWFLLAFYLNPAVHEVTLFEFRRVVPAMPFLAMALHALYTKRRGRMAIGLALALLCKENVGFIVFMIGFYLLVFERDWKWGIPVMLVGGAWAVLVSLWVIPAFAPPSDGPSTYPLLRYFNLSGIPYDQVLDTLLRDPLRLIQPVFGIDRLQSLGRILLPLGLVLPFLAPGWALICLPSLAYMLISGRETMYTLSQWYMATVLPVLFAAIAVGVGRLPRRWAGWAITALVVTAILGFLLYSPAPLGGAYDPSLYETTDHHRLAAEVVDAVPEGAIVATQPRYTPHLSHREHIYHYPWVSIGLDNVDYIVLDRHSNPYPFTPDELNGRIDDLLADPSYVVEMEADGIYAFRRHQRSLSVAHVFDGTMGLCCHEVAVQDERGFFQAVDRQPLELRAGQQLRVSLYWEALDAPIAERTVSVRIVGPSGTLVAQQDNQPGQGKKPTSWWQPGWQIRDVYYLTVSPQAQAGPGRLDLLVYDSHSGEIVPLDDGLETLGLRSVTVVAEPPS